MASADRRNEWRKRQIILPDPALAREDENKSLALWLSEWHGGQFTAVYALSSTGAENLVSLSMIDAALDELESEKPDAETKKDLEDLIGDLDTVRVYWREHSAKEAGMLVGEDEATFYEYDRQDYGTSEAEERKLAKGRNPERHKHLPKRKTKYKVRSAKGIRRRKGNPGHSNPKRSNPARSKTTPAKIPDVDAARELELYIDNDADLYFQRYLPMIINQLRKKKRGIYDAKKAPRLWLYLVDAGAQKYAKEFASARDWHKIFDITTRRHLAERYARNFEDLYKEGEFKIGDIPRLKESTEKHIQAKVRGMR